MTKPTENARQVSSSACRVSSTKSATLPLNLTVPAAQRRTPGALPHIGLSR